jgi:hypothetical protein
MSAPTNPHTSPGRSAGGAIAVDPVDRLSRTTEGSLDLLTVREVPGGADNYRVRIRACARRRALTSA